MIMTEAAVMALALTCLPPSLAPIAVGIAKHENPRLDTTALNHNVNGTVDYGLGQINTVNLGWLGLTPQTVLDPCLNLKAAIRVMFARYNGNPPPAVKASYSAGLLARVGAVDNEEATTLSTPCPTQDPTGWRTVALSPGCRQDNDWHVTPRTKDLQ